MGATSPSVAVDAALLLMQLRPTAASGGPDPLCSPRARRDPLTEAASPPLPCPTPPTAGTVPRGTPSSG